MNNFEYNPKGVCSSKMLFDIENNVIKDVKIIGGCPGNTLGVSILVKNQNIDNVIDKLKDIKCGAKGTSCPAQLANALIEYKNNYN